MFSQNFCTRAKIPQNMLSESTRSDNRVLRLERIENDEARIVLNPNHGILVATLSRVEGSREVNAPAVEQTLNCERMKLRVHSRKRGVDAGTRGASGRLSELCSVCLFVCLWMPTSHKFVSVVRIEIAVAGASTASYGMVTMTTETASDICASVPLSAGVPISAFMYVSSLVWVRGGKLMGP